MAIMIITIIGIVFLMIGCTTECQQMRVVGLAICVLLALGLLGYCTLVTTPEWYCKKSADAMGVECKFDFFAGCLVKYNGSWYPINSRRVLE